jgi:hypothetical protein
MLPNRESGPQNQPRAKVAVSVRVGMEVSIGGIAMLSVTLASCSGIAAGLQPGNRAGSNDAATAIDSGILNFILYTSAV